jgi:dolichyl-phosphate beta-glucosyltransferase
MKPTLSIILPSYNNAASLANQLPLLISYLRKKRISYEIIIVDDGSTDQTVQKIESDLRRIKGLTLIQLKTNQGKGAAVKKGMRKARGQFCIFTDCDIPFTFDAFDRFIYYLKIKEFDVVVGDRTLAGSSYFKQIPIIRKIGSDVFSFLAGRFVAGGYFDTQCGMKGFRASVARDIFSVTRIKRFAFDVEILYIALKRNYDIKRLPVTLRNNETSSVHVIRDGIRMIFDLCCIPLNNYSGCYKKI